MNLYEHFICPICRQPLAKVDNCLKCDRNHSFDFSSAGYVNLLNPGKKNNAKAGDSKEMIKARSSFFDTHSYQPIADKICELAFLLNPHIIVDAGCGEGYYTKSIAHSLPDSIVLGFDMSKFGCEHGAKVGKRSGINNICYSVGNIFDLPIEDSSCDLIINMFAPVAFEEFYRILAPGGHFIVASAGINHLNGLKALLYDDVYPNEEKFLTYDGFDLISTENLKYDCAIIGNEAIQCLFTMTPYFHRTSYNDKQKLVCVSELSTTIEVNFTIYQKKH